MILLPIDALHSQQQTELTIPKLFLFQSHSTARLWTEIQIQAADCEWASSPLCFVSAQWLSASTDPVEVIEGSPELVQLLLADALGVSRQDLVLDLIDGAGDGGE